MKVKNFRYSVVLLSILTFFFIIPSFFIVPPASSMGGGGCFLGDTAIMLSDGSVKKISDLKAGEYVAGFDEQGSLMRNVVMNVFKFEADNYFLLKTSNSEVKVTAEHPFYVGNGDYKTVKELNVGDYVYILNGNSVAKEKILSKQQIDQAVTVYNLRVSNTNNYFANFFAVHNKGGGGGGDGGRETTVRTTISTSSTTSTTTTIPTCSIDCNTLDNWYDTGSFSCNGDCQRCKPQEYRDYSCVGVQCVPAVTNTRQFCEYAATGNHCVSGSFTSSSYCGSSSAYCSGDCGYKIDRYECSGSHVCNYVDYSDASNCPGNTVCSAGSCVSDQACDTGGYQCKDQCSKAKPQYRCDGSGSCSSFWKWIDSSSCNPYSCSGGSCNGCEKDCGAECETSGDCPNKCVGDTRYYSGSCTFGCSCSYNTEECTGDGWYDASGWSCQSDCQRCKQQEYRNYYCTPAGCTYSVTNTQQVCENAPVGKHCSDGVFTTTGYCGSSSAYCSDNCRLAVDKYECGVSGACDYFDSTQTTFCAAGTACSSGQCRSDTECGYSDLVCKDKCSAAKKMFQCNGYGSCNLLWQWVDVTTCNPFSCSSGSCTSSCEKDCGAECEADRDCCSKSFCQDNVLHFSGTCNNDCKCDFKTEDCGQYSGWYDYGSATKWIACNDNPCMECKQKQQRYRDYYCGGDHCYASCKYRYGDYRWVDTGEKREKTCSSGNMCVNGVCVKKPCSGELQLVFNKDTICPKTSVSATASGVGSCSGNKVEFHLDSCVGKSFGYCIINSYGTCTKSLYFSGQGSFKIVACADLNYDKDFSDSGETASKDLTVTCNGCNSSYCKCVVSGHTDCS